MRSFVWGFVAALVVFALGAYAAVSTGGVPARADTPPFPFEAKLAAISLDATVNREAPQPPYPFPSTAPAIVEGAQLYARHCSVCHGTNVAQYTTIAHGLYVRPPQFARHDVADDPAGVTYWKIEHGIRFTGMPAYGGSLTEREVWNIAFFLATDKEKLPPQALQIYDQPLPADAPTLPPGVPTPPPPPPHGGASAAPAPADSTSATPSPSAAPSPHGGVTTS